MEFITDRTLEDVYLAQRYEKMNWSDFSDEEKTEWINGHTNGQGLKGVFNYTDWNRIVTNANALNYLTYGKNVEIKNTREDTYSTGNFEGKKVIIYNPAKFKVTVVPYTTPTTPDTEAIKGFDGEINYYEDTSESGHDHLSISFTEPQNKDEIINTRVATYDTVADFNFTEPQKTERSVVKKTDFQELENHSLTISYRHPQFYNPDTIDKTINTSYEFINKVENRMNETFKYLNRKEQYEIPTVWLKNKTIDDNGNEIDTEEDIFLTQDYLQNFIQRVDGKGISHLDVPKGTVIKVYKYSGKITNYSGVEEYVATEEGITLVQQVGVYFRIAIPYVYGKITVDPYK